MMIALAALAVGTLSGLFFQNYYGPGRILQTAGVLPRANQTVTRSTNCQAAAELGRTTTHVHDHHR
jgi:hypothetical protein